MTANNDDEVGEARGAPLPDELAQLLPVGVFTTDETGRCTFVNDQWCELSGLAPEAALGRGWVDALHPDDRAELHDSWRRFVAGPEPLTMEFRFLAADGTERWVRSQARAHRDDAGRFTGCVGTVTDLTDRRATLIRLARLVERTADLVVVIDAAGKIAWVNETTERVLGRRRQQILGTRALELVHPDDVEQAQAGLELAASREDAVTPAVVRVHVGDGTWREIEVAATNLLTQPAVRGIVLLGRDVSERRGLERRVDELEHSFTASFRYSPVGRAVVDLDGRWREVNDAFAELLGRPAAELVGSFGIDAVHPDDRVRVRADIGRLVAGEVDGVTVEVRFVRPDGETVWARFTVWIVVGDDGQPLHYACDVTDVTEVRAALDAEDRARREFEALVEQSSDIITVLEPDGTWRSSSAGGTRILGYPRGFDPEGGIFGLVHPDDVEAGIQAFEQVVAGTRRPSETVMLRLRAADGAYRYLETAGHDLSADPAVHGIVLNSRDVTDRVVADAAKRDVEQRLHLLLEHSSDLIVVLDADGTLRYLSSASQRLFGRAAADVVGIPVLDLVHPDDVDAVTSTLSTVSDEPGRESRATFRVLHADGSTRWVEAIARNLLDDPSLSGIVINVRDISERIETETALRETQARFAALVDRASDIITVNKLDGILTYVSPSMSRVLGYDAEAMVGTQARDHIHPDDVERVEQTAAEQFASRIPSPIAYRARHADGSWRVLDAIITDLLDEPAVEGVVTNARDVTERRAAERRAEELVDILDATSELIVVSDPQGSVVYANRSARALLGAYEEQHVGKLSSEPSRDRLRGEIMPMVRRRGTWSGELELVDPDGGLIPVAVTIQAHRDEQGQVARLATIAHDISELKAAQRRLEFEATHDSLTGLPNRALFREIGDRAIARAGRTGEGVAVLFLDLDGFKLVNDSYGHDTGDLLLGMVARRLREAVRTGDVLARLGGDEFVILCEHPRGAHQMVDLSSRIIDTVSQPFTINDHSVAVGLSIGIAISRGSDGGLADLIREADIALYRAKREGRGRAEMFEPAVDSRG